jgi:hypothetical protein
MLSVAILVLSIGGRLVSLSSVRADAGTYRAQTAAVATDASGADWQQEMVLLGGPVTLDPNATSTNDSIAMIGPMVTAELIGSYAGLQESGTASPDTVAQIASDIAPNVRAVITYPTYQISDLTTDSNTSYERMLAYRTDLRTAFAPLLKNTDAELDLYAKYVETSDPQYLTKLLTAAENYRAAASSTLKVVVPRDAVNYHIAVLDAMQEFAATITAMATHPNDAIANTALLRSYNTAEADMLNSFNNLSAYYGQKTP